MRAESASRAAGADARTVFDVLPLSGGAARGSGSAPGRRWESVRTANTETERGAGAVAGGERK